jgi:hypothetical protein
MILKQKVLLEDNILSHIVQYDGIDGLLELIL